MSRKDTYSDAMNDWAAKQSFFRNRSNRIIHPDPNSPGFIRFLGYFLRLAALIFVVWLVGTKLASKYFRGNGFNEKLQVQMTSYLDAEELDAENFTFIRKKAVCKKISATGNENAPYRSFEAKAITFQMPLLKRFKEAWTIDSLNIGQLNMELKSGGKSQKTSTSAHDPAPQLIHAGIIPNPDFKKLTIARTTCTKANLSWGLSKATKGRLDGSKLELTPEAKGWRMRLTEGLAHQNWIRDLHIDDLLIRKEDRTLSFSDSSIRLGNDTTPGTLEGKMTLGEIPKADLNLKFPKVKSRDLFPKGANFPDLFNSDDVKLSLNITGSTNSFAGIETSGKATLSSGEHRKLPAFEALDQLLKTNNFRVFMIEEGEVEFRTRGGKLEITRLECTQPEARAILRGNFTYSPAVTAEEAQAAQAINFDGEQIVEREDHVVGSLQLGVRPSVVEANPLAKSFFTKEAEGYMWIEFPLDSPLRKATQEQQSAILQAINSGK